MPRNTNPNTYRTFRSNSIVRKIDHVLSRKKSIYAYLDRMFSDCQEFDAVGFNFMYGQARRFPSVLDWCYENDVRVLHLIRDNILKVYISRQVAKKRGIYIAKSPIANVKVKIDVNRIVAEIQKIESAVEKYREIFSSASCLEVLYENMIADGAVEFQRIATFLNVGMDSAGDFKTDVVKTSPDALDALVENYEDVCAVLSDSRYARFLY